MRDTTCTCIHCHVIGCSNRLGFLSIIIALTPSLGGGVDAIVTQHCLILYASLVPRETISRITDYNGLRITRGLPTNGLRGLQIASRSGGHFKIIQVLFPRSLLLYGFLARPPSPSVLATGTSRCTRFSKSQRAFFQIFECVSFCKGVEDRVRWPIGLLGGRWTCCNPQCNMCPRIVSTHFDMVVQAPWSVTCNM